MADFNKIKQILRESHENKLIVLDGDDAYVVTTLDEYRQLKESQNFVAKIESHGLKPKAGQDNKNSLATDESLQLSHQNRAEQRFYADHSEFAAGQAHIDEMNADLNQPENEDNQPEVRYESYNNQYSEEPL